MSAAKPKVAFYWCASCGGCEEAVVDLAEGILGVLDAVEIVFWPVALDFKKHDVEALADGELAATFLNGAIRTSEQEEMARLLRRKSRHLIAYGACAQLGGIPGLANQFDRERLLRYVYEEAPTVANPERTRPLATHTDDGRVLTLPEFRHGVRSLDQVVAVDYYLPGCPPTPKLTQAAISALLEGRLPPRGAVLAPDIALCDQCPRKETKPSDLSFERFRQPHEVEIDPAKCLLAQGVVCMGPATRGGCEALCPAGNMPCTGCFGPTSRVRDQGAKMLSSLAANVAAREPAEIAAALAGIPDPVGTFYRYGLAKSLLRRRAPSGNGGSVTRTG
ncbi:MAG TPA: oxidoreductase [Opitutaceae bacterium]|nr:oxidoreductase [Opitutaceae bacterium]